MDKNLKPRIGILSPFGVHCGIARAGQVTVDVLENFEIEILNLDRGILIHDGKATSRKRAKTHLELIVKSANTCDLIIWQHEPGTLGRNWREQLKSHKKICGIRTPIIVELHTVLDFEHVSILKNQIKFLARFIRKPRNIKFVQELARITARVRFWKKIYMGLSRLTSTTGTVIVHREIDQEILKMFGKFQGPIVVEELDSLTNEMLQIRDNPPHMFELLQLSRVDILLEQLKDDFIVVQPGFISRYKGHMTSIEALRLLPEFVHLIILGEIHGVTADKSPGIAQMTEELQSKLLEKEYKNILHRVHFIPTPSDIEIAASIYSSDAVLLPYFETGQSGSGPFAESKLLGSQIICSNIPAFRRYGTSNRNIHFHDVGNVFQIRDLILTLNELRKIDVRRRRRVSFPWTAKPISSRYRDVLQEVVHKTLEKTIL